MKFKIFFFFIVVMLCKKETNGETSNHINSIFLVNDIVNYCDKRLQCKGRNHTLCFLSLEVKNNGSVYHEYEMEDRIKDILLVHNGIRNRISIRMNIPNMERVIWDEELSHMALAWLRYKRTPWILDPCANFAPKLHEKVPEFHFVVQNSLFIRYKFLPQNFISSKIRSWYLEKNDMKNEPPLTRIPNETTIKRDFYLHNNFTVLAYPQISRLGCAMVRLEDGFAFLCNYYRYIPKDKIDFGKPTTNCPNKYPLGDLHFENLCFDGSGSQQCAKGFIYILTFFLPLWLKNFI